MAHYGHTHIDNGDVNSQEIILGGANLIAVQIPSAMTNTSLKVQAKFDADDDWDDLYYQGVLVSVSATPSTKQKFSPGSLVGLYSVRLVATGVGNETARRELSLQIDGLV